MMRSSFTDSETLPSLTRKDFDAIFLLSCWRPTRDGSVGMLYSDTCGTDAKTGVIEAVRRAMNNEDIQFHVR